MSVDPNTVLEKMVASARQFNDIENFSLFPGIYGVFFWGSTFPLGSARKAVENRSLIYVGKTESSQVERDLHQHFASGETGRSTLRRSIGAILRRELGLLPEPRNGREKSDRKYRNYKFEAGGENRLTEWMRTNLGLSFFEYDEPPIEIKRLERQIIAAASPILNLTNNRTNLWRSEIRRLRDECVDLARTNGQSAPVPQHHTSHIHRPQGSAMSDQSTLHEAMRIVLQGRPNRTATFASVAKEIADRSLYSQRVGGSAPASQIRLRARKYPDVFEIVPPDKVRLV